MKKYCGCLESSTFWERKQKGRRASYWQRCKFVTWACIAWVVRQVIMWVMHHAVFTKYVNCLKEIIFLFNHYTIEGNTNIKYWPTLRMSVTQKFLMHLLYGDIYQDNILHLSLSSFLLRFLSHGPLAFPCSELCLDTTEKERLMFLLWRYAIPITTKFVQPVVTNVQFFWMWRGNPNWCVFRFSIPCPALLLKECIKCAIQESGHLIEWLSEVLTVVTKNCPEILEYGSCVDICCIIRYTHMHLYWAKLWYDLFDFIVTF